MVRKDRLRAQEPPASFRSFQASELFCPSCRVAMPVREHLLLVLPDGDLYEYHCATCGTSLGKRRVDGAGPKVLLS